MYIKISLTNILNNHFIDRYDPDFEENESSTQTNDVSESQENVKKLKKY